MKRVSWIVWGMVGAACGGLGWIVGGPLGSLRGQTILATALAAASIDLLGRRPLRALVVGLSAALASAAIAFNPSMPLMLAWPATGLVLGLAGAIAHRGLWPRLMALVLTPVLGTCGFLVGAVVVAIVGFGLNSARILDEIWLGGSAAFGFAAVAASRLIERPRATSATVAGGAA